MKAYPSSQPEESEPRILFHPRLPKWAVVNPTGLEMASRLSRGESVEEVARVLAEEYRITFETARRDVSGFANRLTREGFLNRHEDDTAAPLTPRITSIFFHLTDRCNLHCPQCYISSFRNGSGKDLRASLVLRLIEELKETATGNCAVTFSGGEPMLYPEIRKILQFAASRARVDLLSNGTLIDREWAAFLSDLAVFVQISLDGSGEELHDAIRGKGSFRQALQAIRYLQEAGLGPRIRLCTTVMRRNLHDLTEVIGLAERLEIPSLRFLPLRKAGRGRINWASLGSMPAKDYEEFFDYVAGLQAKRKSRVEISCGLSGLVLALPDEASAGDAWCPVGNKLVIDTDGKAYPCVLLMRDQFTLGNAYENRLEEMARSERMAAVCRILRERRTRIEKCVSCTWRNLCQSGCMGEAVENKGTVWATDDLCDYRKRRFQEAFDKILATCRIGLREPKHK